MTVPFIAQATPDSSAVSDNFLQYGAIGSFLIICLFAIWQLVKWAREVYQKSQDDREQERQDKLAAQAENRELHRLIREDVFSALLRANEVNARVVEVLERKSER